MNGPQGALQQRCHLRLRSAAVPMHGLSAGSVRGAYQPPAGGPAGTALEIYHDDDHPRHQPQRDHLSSPASDPLPTVALASMEEVPSPSITKLLFEAERMTACESVARQSWSTGMRWCRQPLSAGADGQGANKGGMVRQIWPKCWNPAGGERLLRGRPRQRHPMLTFARTAFAPANAIQAVHEELPGITFCPTAGRTPLRP